MRERKGGWERGRDIEEGRGEEGEGEKRETSLGSCAFPSFYSSGPWRYFTYTSVQSLGTSLVAQMVKRLSTMREN